MLHIKSRMNRLVFRHPYTTLGIFFLAVIMAAFSLPFLLNDPNPWLLNENHIARVNLEKLRQQYTGSRDSVFILLEAKDTIYTPETLTRIKHLTHAFESMMLIDDKDRQSLSELANRLKGEAGETLSALIENGIENAFWDELDDVRRIAGDEGQWTTKDDRLFDAVITRLKPVIEVTSLSNTDNITATDEGLDVNPVFDDVPLTRAGLDEIKAQVTGNRLFNNILFTDDPRYTSIVIELATHDSDSENQYRVYDRILTILDKDIPGPENHYISGMPVASATLGHEIQVDSKRLFPVVLSIVVVFLLITFRRIMGVLTPVLVVVLSLVMTLGAEALLGIPVNVITAALPVFILSIGVADGIHFYSEYKDHLTSKMDKRQALEMTFDELFSPIIMTSLTTAGAFLALSVTEIVQLRHFGLFVALGTLIAMVFSLMFIPSLLLIVPSRPVNHSDKVKTPVLERLSLSFLQTVSRFALARPRTVIALFGMIIFVASIGVGKVRIDNDNIRYHKESSPIVISADKINEKSAGNSLLNILVHMDKTEDEPFKRPENLKEIVRLAEFIESRPHVGKVMGLHGLIERINYVLHDENPAFDRIPESVETVGDRDISGYAMTSQFLLLYENGGGDTLTDVVTADYSEVNLPVVLQMNASSDIKQLIGAIEDYSVKHLPARMDLQFSGSGASMVAATNEIVKGQVISLLLSFALTFLLLMYTFRSLAMGLAAMLPLLTTILINFGIMGFFNIPLDIGTAVVSSIVIGIGVDYSIHYLKRFTEFESRGQSFMGAIEKTVHHSGKAILSNAVTVAAGFMALLFSMLTPLITMGWMISVTMIVSAISTVILLPAMLSLLKGRQPIEDPETHLEKDISYASS